MYEQQRGSDDHKTHEKYVEECRNCGDNNREVLVGD